MNILDNLSAIDQSAHELWSEQQVRQAMAALPALIRVARAAEAFNEAWHLNNAGIRSIWDAADDLENALQQLRAAGENDEGARDSQETTLAKSRTPLYATTRVNEWGIFSVPDDLSPAAITEAGLAGKRVRVRVEEVGE